MFRLAHIQLLLFALALLGCSGSKSYAKKAAKLDEAGLYAEAAGMYEQSAQRNLKNVEAKIGLKKTGQHLLDDKLGEFFKATAMGDAKGDAVEAYLTAKSYQERIGRLGVVLDIPDHYHTDFERVKGEYLVDLYNEGQGLMDKQQFKAAEAVFAKIARLEPNYKDASSLQTIAYMEPLYRAGKADLAAGAYRKAYASLNDVVNKDAAYKDASTLRQECLTKGQYSIAVLPFTTTSKRTDVTAKVHAYAMTALTGTSDPFLKVVDRENMERILAEQRLGLSGVVDEQTAVRVGNLIGAQAVLMGEVVDYREVPGDLRRSTKDALESYTYEGPVDPATGRHTLKTGYKPARYAEYLQENKVYLTVNYRLVSLETGEVLMSKVVDQQEQDHMYYADFQGNGDALFPMRNGLPDLGARRELRNLLNAPRQVKSVETLSMQAVSSATSNMAQAVQQELNTKLP